MRVRSFCATEARRWDGMGIRLTACVLLTLVDPRCWPGNGGLVLLQCCCCCKGPACPEWLHVTWNLHIFDAKY